MTTPEQAHEVWMEIYSQDRVYDAEAGGSPADPTERLTPEGRSLTPTATNPLPERKL